MRGKGDSPLALHFLLHTPEFRYVRPPPSCYVPGGENIDNDNDKGEATSHRLLP